MANSERLTVEDVELEFIPLIYDILRNIEKEPSDNSHKSRDFVEAQQKAAELNIKFEQAREQVHKLPGIEYSKERQLNRLDNLRKQLLVKQELLLKYKNMCSFALPKSN